MIIKIKKLNCNYNNNNYHINVTDIIMKVLKSYSYGGDLLGGIVGALITIPIILSCGVISYQNIGVAYITMGISAAFLSSIIASLLAGVFGKSPLHLNSPKTTHAAILSGLMATIASTHVFQTSFNATQAPLALIAVGLITLSISGLTQMILGGFKLGNLVKFIPYPVLAGFINGFALQIILNQVPKALGLDKEKDLISLLEGHLGVNLWAIVFALFSAFLVIGLKKKIKMIPPALIALALGTMVQMGLHFYCPHLKLGAVIGSLPQGIPVNFHLQSMASIMESHFFLTEFMPILITGITLAFISSIQSLLSISATEHLFGAKHNSNRELLIQGGTNFLAAILGGTPSGGSPNTTQVVYANGGRTGLSNIAFAVTILGIAYGLNKVISLIPLSVMAGVVIVTTLSAMDKWTRQLFINIGSSETPESRRDVIMNLLVVILVSSLVIFSSAIIALAVGLFGVMMAFLYRSNARMIRRTLHGAHFHSRTEREHKSMEVLEQHGQQIAIVELDGPIFFGSSESIAKYIEKILPDIKWLILDLKRVSHMDSSGAMMLKRLDEQMILDKKKLFLSYLPEKGNRRQFLHDMGYTKVEKQNRIYINTDMALSDAEDELIKEVLHLPDEMPALQLQDFDAFKHFSQHELAILNRHMQKVFFQAGDIIVDNFQNLNQNAHIHSDYNPYLLFLHQGRISVFSGMVDKKIRSASYLPGMAVCEMILNPPNHVQQLVADTDAWMLKLDLLGLSEESKHIEAHLFKNLALELSYRIAELHDVILELEEN
jgi:sulfate permease, SulP family